MIGTQTIQSSLSRFFGAFGDTSPAVERRTTVPAQGKQHQAATISLRQVADPTEAVIMTVCGNVDRRSYRSLLEKCEQLRTGGIERLVVDLNEMPGLELTCLYALHCIAKTFRDESYADPEHGLNGLRRIAEENFESGIHSHIKLLVTDEGVVRKLKQASVHHVFSIHRTEAGALRAFELS